MFIVVGVTVGSGVLTTSGIVGARVEGIKVGESVVGDWVMVASVGATEGLVVGDTDGISVVGATVGVVDGRFEGMAVGEVDGTLVGRAVAPGTVGAKEGAVEGTEEGAGEIVGAAVRLVGEDVAPGDAVASFSSTEY